MVDSPRGIGTGIEMTAAMNRGPAIQINGDYDNMDLSADEMLPVDEYFVDRKKVN